MAVSKIDKVKIISHEEGKNNILELLYDKGFIEIIKEGESREASEGRNDLEILEYEAAKVRHSLEILKPFYLEKQGFLDKLNFEIPSLEQKKIDDLVLNFNYKLVSELIGVMGQDYNSLKGIVLKVREDIAYLSPWQEFAMPTNQAHTEKTEVVFGYVEDEEYENMKKLPENLLIEVISRQDSKHYICAIILKDEYKDAMEFLESRSFKKVDLPVLDISIKTKIERLMHEESVALARIDNLKGRLGIEAGKHYLNLQIIADYLKWRLDKELVQDNFTFTRNTFCVTGWLPQTHRKELEKELSGISEESAILDVAVEEGEEPPVLMENKKIIQPFEFVTNIYGYPRHNEIDPTPFLAGFFIIFFGLCLTDAGYGITLITLSFLALRFLKVGAEFRKLLNVLFFGGIITVAAGGLTGGWFGIVLEDLPAWLSRPLMGIRAINPVENPITILIISLILGYLHLVFGNVINLWWRVKHNQLKEGLVESGVWLSFLLTAGLWLVTASFAGPATTVAAKYLFFASVLAIILTRGKSKNFFVKILGGLGDLYFGITGYISDILSYSRLLALGLATGIIGMVINVIGLMAYDLVPYVGWLLMILIIVGGHIFNLVISLIGAFIHSGRLQYVEFFKTFFEGGGRKFSPFTRKSQYIYLIKE